MDIIIYIIMFIIGAEIGLIIGLILWQKLISYSITKFEIELANIQAELETLKEQGDVKDNNS